MTPSFQSGNVASSDSELSNVTKESRISSASFPLRSVRALTGRSVTQDLDSFAISANTPSALRFCQDIGSGRLIPMEAADLVRKYGSRATDQEHGRWPSLVEFPTQSISACKADLL